MSDPIARFADELQKAYPHLAKQIRACASEDSGPTLRDYDVYGPRVDTGLRVDGLPIWRYPSNGVHICERAAGSHHCLRWVEHDPAPAPAPFLRAAGIAEWYGDVAPNQSC
ncbi:hypothetical protein ACU4GI_32950 [Cupriavidus basilensis]